MDATDRPDLASLAALGPFFALAVGGPEPGAAPVGGVDAGTGLAPAAGLIGSPAAVDRWLDWGARRLGTDDRPVVASLLYQGWAARFTSIYAGAVALAGAAPALGLDGLAYRYPEEGGPVDLAVAEVAWLPPAAAWRHLVDANLAPVAQALRGRVRVGRRLLWGNVASALAGSLAALDRAGHGPLDRLVAAPWARPDELAGLGRWSPDPATGALRFRRTTCCLYERLPGAGRCGDCSLDAP
ncbi:MAG TPA: (2Fe-2S)-binding protein [Acidimicrobiales bacterium]